jgi:hypothetical protein
MVCDLDSGKDDYECEGAKHEDGEEEGVVKMVK